MNRDQDGGYFINSREVHCDGLIEYIMLRHREADEHRLALPIQWIMGLFAKALCDAEKFRRAAGAPDVEYGLEVEIASSVDLPIARYGSHRASTALGPLPTGTIFPRYGVGPWEGFQSLSHTFERDLWNGAGHDFPILATIGFEPVLRDLGIDADVSR